MKEYTLEKVIKHTYDTAVAVFTNRELKTTFHVAQDHININLTEWDPPLPEGGIVVLVDKSERKAAFSSPVKGKVIRKIIRKDFTRCVETQVLNVNEKRAVIEASTQLFDIPNADRYNVKHLFTLAPHGNDSCHIHIHASGAYGKKLMRDTIEKKLIADIEVVLRSWVDLFEAHCDRYTGGMRRRRSSCPLVDLDADDDIGDDREVMTVAPGMAARPSSLGPQPAVARRPTAHSVSARHDRVASDSTAMQHAPVGSEPIRRSTVVGNNQQGTAAPFTPPPPKQEQPPPPQQQQQQQTANHISIDGGKSDTPAAQPAVTSEPADATPATTSTPAPAPTPSTATPDAINTNDNSNTNNTAATVAVAGGASAVAAALVMPEPPTSTPSASSRRSTIDSTASQGKPASDPVPPPATKQVASSPLRHSTTARDAQSTTAPVTEASTVETVESVPDNTGTTESEVSTAKAGGGPEEDGTTGSGDNAENESEPIVVLQDDGMGRSRSKSSAQIDKRVWCYPAEEYTRSHFYLACIFGDYGELEKRIEADDYNPMEVNARGWTPLHRAASNGHEKIVEKLIELDVNVNAADHEGFLPLHNAVLYGHIGIVEKLIAAGSKQRPAVDGRTPLDMSYGTNPVSIAIRHILKGDQVAHHPPPPPRISL